MRNAKIASLKSGARLSERVACAVWDALLTVRFPDRSALVALATVSRSIDCADCCSARTCSATGEDWDTRAMASPKNDRASRSSMNTELPQLVQKDRVGSHRRRHEPQIISSASYAISARGLPFDLRGRYN